MFPTLYLPLYVLMHAFRLQLPMHDIHIKVLMEMENNNPARVV